VQSCSEHVSAWHAFGLSLQAVVMAGGGIDYILGFVSAGYDSWWSK